MTMLQVAIAVSQFNKINVKKKHILVIYLIKNKFNIYIRIF